jgi:arginyl-tRNA synthetase
MNSSAILRKTLLKYSPDFSLDQPEEIHHGDFATNIAFIIAKSEKKSPKACAEELIPKLQNDLSDTVEKIELAGAGFINFFLNDKAKEETIKNVANNKTKLSILSGKTVICEYTDPNPFKLFHIGHLVPNAIGESLSRIYEQVGADVKRICYQGDIGMHVATTIWGIENMGDAMPDESASLREKVAYLGKGYAYGTAKLADDSSIKDRILEINKHLFEGSEHALYEKGKKWSLDYFGEMYKKIGTAFDYFIFESEVGESGKKIVIDNTPNVFEQSDGAYVYKGEKVGLHTRVFVNSQGLPTYEAKELGNTFRKEELVPKSDISIVVTANEINEYFKVIKAALGEIDKAQSDKLVHISHGMLRLPEGKMSSRTGNIIPAEDLIDEVKSRLKDRLEKSEEMDKEKLGNDVAVGAIKFSILKLAPGKDIIFDIDKSISFEGDSGPYLQYTHARIVQLLKKAENEGIKSEYMSDVNENALSRKLLIFEDVIGKAYEEKGPHIIVNYLLALAHEFNSFYTRQVIADKNNPHSAHYVLLTYATWSILNQGLHMLGITAPEKM